MNNFKRFMALMLVLVTVLAFAACTGNTDTTGSTTTAPTTTAPTTTAPTSTAAKVITYRVKVVDEAGNPVEGVGVQLCKEACIIRDTNAEGWAEFENPVEDGYHANIAYALEVPDGKKVDATEYDFESGVTEMTITLKFVDEE